jgi:hypothetical protein
MSIGSRPNIEHGGVAAPTNAMATYVRYLVGPSARHGYRIDAAKMPMTTPVAVTSIIDSIAPMPMRGCSVASNQSPGTGVAAQIP